MKPPGVLAIDRAVLMELRDRHLRYQHVEPIEGPSDCYECGLYRLALGDD